MRRLMKHKRPLDVRLFSSLSFLSFGRLCLSILAKKRERATEDMMALICCRPEFRTENMTVQKSAKRLFFSRRKYLFLFQTGPIQLWQIVKWQFSLAWSLQECNIVIHHIIKWKKKKKEMDDKRMFLLFCGFPKTHPSKSTCNCRLYSFSFHIGYFLSTNLFSIVVKTFFFELLPPTMTILDVYRYDGLPINNQKSLCFVV